MSFYSMSGTVERAFPIEEVKVKSYLIDFEKVNNFIDIIDLAKLLKFKLELRGSTLDKTFLNAKNQLEIIYKNVVISNVSDNIYLRFLKEV